MGAKPTYKAAKTPNPNHPKSATDAKDQYHRRQRAQRPKEPHRLKNQRTTFTADFERPVIEQPNYL
tara:strand:- start:1266 stop:1463 length:198 start_codon:yes stop_codon:yes gene_type:complete